MQSLPRIRLCSLFVIQPGGTNHAVSPYSILMLRIETISRRTCSDMGRTCSTYLRRWGQEISVNADYRRPRTTASKDLHIVLAPDERSRTLPKKTCFLSGWTPERIGNSNKRAIFQSVSQESHRPPDTRQTAPVFCGLGRDRWCLCPDVNGPKTVFLTV